MTDSADDDLKLIPPTLIKRWVKELEHIDAEMKKLGVRREKFQSLLAAAAQFSPVARSAKPQQAPSNPSKRIYRGYTKNSKPVPVELAGQASIGLAIPASKPQKNVPKIRTLNRETWSSAIMGVLAKNDGPVSYAKLREGLLETSFREKIQNHDKFLYSAVIKLRDNKMIATRNKHLFSVDAYEKFMKALENKEIPDVQAPPREYRSKLGDVIMAILKKFPAGLESKEIMAELKNIPGFEYAADPDNTTVYNVLKRLIKEVQVSKPDGRYVLVGSEHPFLDDLLDDARWPSDEDLENTEAAPTVKEGAA